MIKEVIPHYRPNDLPPPQEIEKVEIKDDGTVKKRKVWDYCDDDKARQQYALDLLRTAHVASGFSKGGQPGARVTHNVYPHLQAWKQGGERAFHLIDLKDAYPNIDSHEVGYKFYELIGRKGVGLSSLEIDFLETYLHEEVGAFLTVDGRQVKGAPQGNATSGAMLDILLNKTDNKMGRWLAQGSVSGVYTRWIDDLTFSSPLIKEGTGKFQDSARRTLRRMLKDTPGVVINDSKTKNFTGEKPMTITGISFNKHGLMAPSDGILVHVGQYLVELSEKLSAGEAISEHDINVFDGYRAALAIAGPPERSQSQVVRSLYSRSIRIGNRAYTAAARQGAIRPRKPLLHVGAEKAHQ